MTFETLYKRTRTGAIQFWNIETRDSDMLEGAQIKKTSGQLGTTNPVIHIEAIHEGKNIGKSNKTTPFQQAELQAKSDWTQKHDEGYKSLADLKIVPCTDQVHFPDLYMYPGSGILFQTLLMALNTTLPKFNTDASGNVKPMLAKPVNWDNVTYPCYVQPKLDGVRCLMVVDFTQTKPITFLSRSGKEYTTLEHIATDMIKSSGTVPIKFILDGEIYSDEITFQEIIAAVKKQRPDSLKLKFRAYDIVNGDKQVDRWADTVALVDSIASPLVWPVITLTVQNKEDVQEAHNQWVAEGNEGAMIRLLNGTYDQGQRSSSLLKVKEFDSTEFPFIRFEVGQREEDLIAVCTASNGVCFKAKVIGNREEKQKLQTIPEKQLEYKQYIIKHFGLTDDGLPRFPIGVGFRDYE